MKFLFVTSRPTRILHKLINYSFTSLLEIITTEFYDKKNKLFHFEKLSTKIYLPLC